MEEITPKYNLKIYVDNVYCDATQHVSCPRSLIISYKSDVIVLKSQNLIGASELEVICMLLHVKFFLICENNAPYYFVNEDFIIFVIWKSDIWWSVLDILYSSN